MSIINKTAVLNPLLGIMDNIIDYVPRATTSEFGIVAIGSGINVDQLGRIYLDTQEYSDRLAAIEAQAASSLATQQTEVAAAIAQVNLAQSQTITALTLEVDNLKTDLTNEIAATEAELIDRADQLAQEVTDITDQLALDKAAFTQEIQDALVYLENAESVASALRTPRKIQTVPFDGTQDINLPVFTSEIDGLVPKRVGATSTKYLREDGTWVVPTDTTYALLTQANAEAGTATTANTISAQVLKEAIKFHAPPVTDIAGNAGTATKLQTARTISFSGAATGSFSYDGSSNSSAILTLADSGVTANTYGASLKIPTITVNAKGLITGVSEQNIPMVDDLTTDAGNKPLSARQGKKLQDEKLSLAGGQLSGKLTTKPSYLAQNLDDIGAGDNSPIHVPWQYIPLNMTGYIPFVHGSVLTNNYGYLTHVSMGAYRGSNTWYNSGAYIAVGGKDEAPTEAFMFLNGRKISNTAGPIDLVGNASSANKLAIPRNVFGQNFDGSGDVGGTITASTGLVQSDNFHYIDMGRNGLDRMSFYNYGATFNFIDSQNGNVVARITQNGIDCNAATATALQTARTINGTSFNGSANIITTNWGTTRTLTIGSTGKSVNGSADISWSADEILPTGTSGQVLKHNGTSWVASIDSNATYTAMSATEANTGTATLERLVTAAVLKGAIQTHAPVQTSVTGNAGSATKLATARTINGVSFDGTNNINVDAYWNANLSTNMLTGSATSEANKSGMYAHGIYNGAAIGYPFNYGNRLQIHGFGAAVTELFMEWSGNTTGRLFYRSRGDITTHNWSVAKQIAFTDDNIASATRLQTARNFQWTGDATGLLSFNGTANVSAALTLANSGVAAGTYKSVTVDAKGRVTAGTNVVTGLITSTTAAGTANVATTNTNTFLNIIETVGTAVSTTGSSTQITGDGTVTVTSDAAGKITITGSQTITGNAATATSLQTARTINGVSFDGTANIEIPFETPTATETVAGKAKIATTAIAQAGTNDTDIITAKKLQDVAGKAIKPRSWSNVTASRIAETWYTNTTGNDVGVFVLRSGINTSASITVRKAGTSTELVLSGTNVGNNLVATSSGFWEVPDGFDYKISVFNVVMELRV